MKYLKIGITIIITSLAMNLVNVNAAGSVSVSASANYVEEGNKVTFYINLKNVAAWDLTGAGYGATSGCSLGDQGVGDSGTGANINKTLTVTCKSTSVGQISFNVSGNVSSASGTNIEKANINTSKIVVVTEPREKDSNNYLKSIGVTGYTLTPEFNQDTMEYTVEVPNTVDKVTLEASAASGYASVNGTGEVEVNEGVNTFEIKVTSETGVERIYKITVNVKDENPINIKINNAEYTIMKNVKNIEIPSTYEVTTVNIKGFDIPAFYSTTSDFTLVSVKDSKGDQYFAIYDAEKNTYELYNENQSNQLLLYILPIDSEFEGFTKTKITILEESYEALKANTEDVYIIYAMDIVTGKKNYYLYDKENNSYTLYNENWINTYTEQLKKYKIGILGFGGLCIFCLLIITIQAIKSPKKKKEKKQKEVKIEEPIIKEEKKEKQKKGKQKNVKEPKKVTEEIPSPTKLTNEEAMKKMDDVTKMIEDYEKTVTLNKKDLEAAKSKEQKEEVPEETMFDILGDGKKKKKKKK